MRASLQQHILVVDDSVLILELVSSILRECGFEHVWCAHNKTSAIEHFSSNEHGMTDLILLDRYLGEDSGIDFIKLVRRTNQTIPIIMLTQEHRSEKVLEAIAAGANDYILKPFSESDLLKKVAKYLALGRAESGHIRGL